ncbi:MAG: hypothetical protein AB1656_25650 [Candidatus Omnitrophota bacterium]
MRVKIFISLTLFLLAGMNFFAFSEALEKGSIADRLAKGNSAILNEKDEGVLTKSLGDLVKYAHVIGDLPSMVEKIDLRLQNEEKSSNLYRQLVLNKAQLAGRNSQWQEAKTLFEQAIAENWPKAIPTYLDCMTAVGKNKERCIEEFNRCVGKPDYLDYRERKEDLSVFRTVLLFAKEDDSAISAVRDVFPYLIFNDKKPILLELTRALCLAADSLFDESIKSLQAIDTLLADKKEDEEFYKTMPLYIAWTMFEAGSDYDAAREWLKVFYQRNPDDAGHVLGRILRIAYFFDRNGGKRHIIPEVTAYLKDSPIFSDAAIRERVNKEVLTNEQMRATMPSDLYWHVLELHAHGLSWRFQWEEAAAAWRELMKECYPATPTGANAAMSLAVYIASKNNPGGRDVFGAIALLEDIVQNAPFDDMLPHVYRLLAKYTGMSGQYEKALEILQEVYNRIPPKANGEMGECLRLSKEMEQGIRKIIRDNQSYLDYKAKLNRKVDHEEMIRQRNEEMKKRMQNQ